MYTVKQISDKYNISRVSIYNHIKQLNKNGKYNNDTKKVKNKLYLNQHLINDLINSFDRSHISKAKSSLNPTYNETKRLKNEVIDLKDQNKILNKELLNEQEENKNITANRSLIIRSNQHGFIWKLFH